MEKTNLFFWLMDLNSKLIDHLCLEYFQKRCAEGTDINYRSYIDLRDSQENIGVCFPSMGDLMANDWDVINTVDIK